MMKAAIPATLVLFVVAASGAFTSPVEEPVTPVAIILSSTVVPAGSSATATVRTEPRAKCRAYLHLNGQPSVLRLLIPYPGRADENGYLALLLTVPRSTPEGFAALAVHCQQGSKQAGLGLRRFQTTPPE
jgi:hypothetical protein